MIPHHTARFCRARRRRAAGAAGLGADGSAPLITRAIPRQASGCRRSGSAPPRSSTPTTSRRAPAAAQVLRDPGRRRRQAHRYRLVLWRCESVLGEVIAAAGLRDKSSSPPSSSARRGRTETLAGPAQDGEGRPAAASQCARSAAVAGPVQGLEGRGPLPLYRHHLDLHGDFAAVEAVLAREQPDFVQIDYSLDDREAEKRMLPLAAEVKAGVLTALPFGRAGCSARCAASRCPIGRRNSPGAGRNSSSNTCLATQG